MKTRTWDRGGRGALAFTELGFGTAPAAGLYRSVDEAEADATYAAAWEAGIRYYDTAPLYGLGLAETRLNRALRGKTGFVTSTKIGRLLRAVPPEARDGIGKWFGVPARREVYDYSYDGTMRSLEFSLGRTGLDRIEVLYAHDLDLANHGTAEALQARLDEFMAGGYRALCALRDQGVIRAFGAGVNAWEPAQWLAERGDFDIFLLAGRYTLLEQEALSSFLPLCTERGIGIVVGGPYNSGVLATGAQPGAFYNYGPAPDWVLHKVARIEAVCQAYGVRLVDAAFQFPLRHPAVVSVIPGGVGPEQVAANARAAAAEIPADLWAELKSLGLLRQDAPVEGQG